VRDRILLIPLDERPVNTGLPRDVAAIAGVDVVLPPASALPAFRTGADPLALADWVRAEADDPNTTAIVVSIDTLAYGGLIPARISTDSTLDCVSRLEVLRDIHRSHPGLPITAVSLVTRATDSYSNTEEPEYWDRFGREIHSFGREVHRSWAASTDVSVPAVPNDVREDFARRRLRNHQVTLSALGMHWDGVIATLAITADDTAEFSAGSAEQELFRYWRTLRPSNALEVYPGADETGAVLVARALLRSEEAPVRIRVVANDAAGMLVVPAYENDPLAATVPRQVRQAGAVIADELPDLVLIVHTPDPHRGDHFSSRVPVSVDSAITATLTAVRAALDSGSLVALADLRFGNGADARLVEALAEANLLWRLAAYAGWNTAGNALGSTIALGIAHALGARRGTLDPVASRRALARRLLDDYAWQAVHRRKLSAQLFHDRIDPLPAGESERAEAVITQTLRNQLEMLDPASPLAITGVTLPWARSFEVDIALGGKSLEL
jgi:hypothetical protein